MALAFEWKDTHSGKMFIRPIGSKEKGEA